MPTLSYSTVLPCAVSIERLAIDVVKLTSYFPIYGMSEELKHPIYGIFQKLA